VPQHVPHPCVDGAAQSVQDAGGRQESRTAVQGRDAAEPHDHGRAQPRQHHHARLDELRQEEGHEGDDTQAPPPRAEPAGEHGTVDDQQEQAPGRDRTGRRHGSRGQGGQRQRDPECQRAELTAWVQLTERERGHHGREATHQQDGA
jgi:hypothetical protein